MTVYSVLIRGLLFFLFYCFGLDLQDCDSHLERAAIECQTANEDYVLRLCPDQDSGFSRDSEHRFVLDKEAKRQFAKFKSNQRSLLARNAALHLKPLFSGLQRPAGETITPLDEMIRHKNAVVS